MGQIFIIVAHAESMGTTSSWGFLCCDFSAFRSVQWSQDNCVSMFLLLFMVTVTAPQTPSQYFDLVKASSFHRRLCHCLSVYWIFITSPLLRSAEARVRSAE